MTRPPPPLKHEKAGGYSCTGCGSTELEACPHCRSERCPNCSTTPPGQCPRCQMPEAGFCRTCGTLWRSADHAGPCRIGKRTALPDDLDLEK